MARRVVGLDMGTTAVRAAEVSVRRGQVVLERVGTSGGTGHLKHYGYDTRLQYPSPPYVQDITETPYRVSQWAETQNPSGCLPDRLASGRCCAISPPGSPTGPRWSPWSRGCPRACP